MNQEEGSDDRRKGSGMNQGGRGSGEPGVAGLLN